MAAKRVILEMGTGNDLHGGDYTKAAVRAVQDAIHHSSLTLIRTLGLDPHPDAAILARVQVRVGEQVRDDLAHACGVGQRQRQGGGDVHVQPLVLLRDPRAY